MSVLAIEAPVRTRRPGVGTAYAWELRKLAAQKRTYIGLGAAVLIPLLFVVSFLVDGSGDMDGVPLGRYATETGLAMPLVGLYFGSGFFLPLIAAIVAGDIVASEDQHGTLKTILTRSVDRWQIYLAKVFAALTYVAAALGLYLGVALVAAGAAWGFDPLVSLSGTEIPVGRSLLLIAASAAISTVVLATFGSIAVLLSSLTRNSAAAIAGTLFLTIVLQVLNEISSLDAIHPYLLTEQFDAWQGFLREPVDWSPITQALWVSAAYAVPVTAVGFTAFLRRDVAGG